MEILFHADDFAVSTHVSEVIASCVEEGCLQSISVMPNMKCFKKCVTILNDIKDSVKVSIHLNIMEGYCVAAKEQIPLLTDGNGIFTISWGKLLVYSLTKPQQLKEQLKIEFKAQINRVREIMPPDYKIRIDSHQHTHMIPLVFKSIMELIQEEKYKAEYIRVAKEQLWPFIKHGELWKTYSVANIIKNLLLNIMAVYDIHLMKLKKEISTAEFMGLVFSGCMDAERVGKVLPDILARSRKKSIEVLFHPGRMLGSEMNPEYNKKGFNSFHLDKGRMIEEKAVGILGPKRTEEF